MCLTVEPELRLSEKAIDKLENMFEYMDQAVITTMKTSYILKDVKYHNYLHYFVGRNIHSGKEVEIPLLDVKGLSIKGRYSYDVNGDKQYMEA